MSTACSSPPVIGGHGISTGGRFAFPRSYFKGLIFATNTFTWSQFDNLFISNVVTPPPTTIRYIINPLFFDWSSNRYTADFVLCESFYYRELTGEKIAAPVNQYMVFDPDDGSVWWKFVNTDGGEGSPAKFTLPPPPSDYWLPP